MEKHILHNQLLSRSCFWLPVLSLLNSTRNPGLDQKWSTLDQKWSTLDQKWSTLDQIWSTLDQNWSNPKIFFWDFCKYFFAQNSILVNYERSWKNNLWMLIPSCIFRLDQKWSRVDQIWSNLEFKVGPLLVQGGPLLVQPRVSSTAKADWYALLFV